MKSLAHRLDASINNVITSWPASLKPLFVATTALGGPLITIAVGTAVILYGYVQENPRLALAGMMVWVIIGIGTVLKLLFGRKRPLTEYVQNMHFKTLSFPSGHATGATIAHGLLAYLAWHALPEPWSYIVAAAMTAIIVLVGISRIYLGAHFPSDVVAGWLLGTAGVLVIIFLIRPLV
ncbi:MAG TPA: phosphatase PAP2 family protein [Candidatus Saccharimonadales bacterium]